MNALELLARWEREDFADCIPPWMRIEHWRWRRLYEDHALYMLADPAS
jgi:hypothetical protein